jgi:hypothetical protein
MSALIDRLNTTWHEKALWIFGAVTVAHWAEHLVQAFQIYALGWARPQSRGLLGQWFPELVKSEYLHYAYAIVMLAFLALLLPGFLGRARFFWALALGIQFWHHIEHLLLLYQRETGNFFFGEAVPTSVLQTVVMRVELHLFYNTIVFIPMIIALILHMFPPESERGLQVKCTCRKDIDHERAHPPAPAMA